MRAAVKPRETQSRYIQTLSSESRTPGPRAHGLGTSRIKNASWRPMPRDVAAAAEAVRAGSMSQAMADRLLLTDKKSTPAAGIRSIAAMDEPIGKVLKRMELADGLLLRQESAPWGCADHS